MSVDAEVDPKLFATKVVSAISSAQYGECSALIPAIASAQPWATAYVSEIRALLQRFGQYIFFARGRISRSVAAAR